MPFVSVLLIAVLIFCDQFTKHLAVTAIRPTGSVEVIPKLLDFTYVENRGMAFGLLADNTFVLVGVTSVFLLAGLFVLFFYKKHTVYTYITVSLIVAGGLGNLIDRIFLHYVIDFIHVSFFPPVFNVADSFITVGVALLVLYVLVIEPKKEKAAKKDS